MSVMQPLRDEHEALLPRVELLRIAAQAARQGRLELVLSAIDAAYSFLAEDLLPHAAAEEAVLYPAVGRVLGSEKATATMSRDHVEVERLTGLLSDLRASIASRGFVEDVVQALERTLYGLYAIVRLHFAKEEEVYVPALEAALSPEETVALFAAMHRAATTAA